MLFSSVVVLGSGMTTFLEILVFVNSAKEVMFSSLLVCLSVCLSVGLLATLRKKNFRRDLHEIFREGWQWAIEQILVAIRIRDPNPNTDPDPGPVNSITYAPLYSSDVFIGLRLHPTIKRIYVYV